jgi:hypothetical protein
LHVTSEEQARVQKIASLGQYPGFIGGINRKPTKCVENQQSKQKRTDNSANPKQGFATIAKL